MTQILDQMTEMSHAQAKAVGQAVGAATHCMTAMLDASAEFAKSSAQRNASFAATILNAKTPESLVDLHNAFAQDAVKATAAMATKISDACTAAARQCGALAMQSANALSGPEAPGK